MATITTGVAQWTSGIPRGTGTVTATVPMGSICLVTPQNEEVTAAATVNGTTLTIRWQPVAMVLQTDIKFNWLAVSP